MVKDLVQSMKEVSSTSDRKAYTLDETLAIVHMFTVEKLKPSAVAALTGRSVNSLRYKFLEGEIVVNGKKVTRSIKRFNSVAEIYGSFGVTYTNEADVTSRINSYRKLSTSVAS